MRSNAFIPLVRSFIVIGLMLWSSSSWAQVVSVCDDGDWAPYSFPGKTDGKLDMSKPRGAMIEFLAELGMMTGLEFQMTYLPWKRCVEEVFQYGKKKRYEAFINGIFTEERGTHTYPAGPVYRTSTAYWYSNDRYPKGLHLQETDELKSYKICGVRGTALGYDLDESLADMGARNIEDVLHKISSGRCDIFPHSVAPIIGREFTVGKSIVPKNVKYGQFDDQTRKDPIQGYYIFISKQSPRGLELFAKIHNAILVHRKKGNTQRIFKKYLDCGISC